jgi:hypothetical protein
VITWRFAKELGGGSALFVLNPKVAAGIRIFCGALYSIIALSLIASVGFIVFSSNESGRIVFVAALICASIFLGFERLMWFVIISRFPLRIIENGGFVFINYANGVTRRLPLNRVSIADCEEYAVIGGLGLFALRLPRAPQ